MMFSGLRDKLQLHWLSRGNLVKCSPRTRQAARLGLLRPVPCGVLPAPPCQSFRAGILEEAKKTTTTTKTQINTKTKQKKLKEKNSVKSRPLSRPRL